LSVLGIGEVVVMDSDSPIRVGVLGCASIAHKNVRAIGLADGISLVAVASRSAEKATHFLRECGLPEDSGVRAVGYDELVHDSEVDALYVPLPSGLHAQWVVKAAAAGKHILLEKPLCLHMKELDDMWAAVEKAGVAVLDGTMFMHHPRLEKLREEMDKLGGPLEVNASFSFQATELADGTGGEWMDSDVRGQKDMDGLGSLGDLGWYTTKLALWTFGFELPSGVMAQPGALHNAAGVMKRGGGTLMWSDGRLARMDYSFVNPFIQDATISCKTGTIRMSDFTLPRDELNCEFTVERSPTLSVPDNGPTVVSGEIATLYGLADKPQEARMMETFAQLCADPRGEEAGKWRREAYLTQKVVLALAESGDSTPPTFVSI